MVLLYIVFVTSSPSSLNIPVLQVQEEFLGRWDETGQGLRMKELKAGMVSSETHIKAASQIEQMC